VQTKNTDTQADRSRYPERLSANIIGEIFGHDTISMFLGMMSCCAKLTGEDLPLNFNKIESVGLRKV